jgi:hypothetical protein
MNTVHLEISLPVMDAWTDGQYTFNKIFLKVRKSIKVNNILTYC